MEWNLWSCCADYNEKSFVFTLKNPHNIPAKRNAMKDIDDLLNPFIDGPYFDDIYVSDDCNANTDSRTSLGYRYINDTGLDGETVFTGSPNFKVKEIEIFEITN
jgi:hypothetical protein